ncbi:hypothetical protein A2482_00040 [Candidatus Falkowbacteria bacterium RIFOXYC2_FULL_48_21]|uniref:Uncharacterized protein n=1 Tax=Candidatus Falkowbacteria bacterium RIFOXYC2_FULL_48_21 TaxID=1798005 RepID=A0A1F5T9M9_9BACT|nr:MAG: hypothetical protein A2482_00040 [Candidatus Falkowbacteria bacterium RIFOXYC2_FULL_48_21]
MSLSKQEEAELELLDNPEIQFLGSAMSPVLSSLVNNGSRGLKARRDRVVALRVKKRFGKEICASDLATFAPLKDEERKRFNERFKVKDLDDEGDGMGVVGSMIVVIVVVGLLYLVLKNI